MDARVEAELVNKLRWAIQSSLGQEEAIPYKLAQDVAWALLGEVYAQLSLLGNGRQRTGPRLKGSEETKSVATISSSGPRLGT